MATNDVKIWCETPTTVNTLDVTSYANDSRRKSGFVTGDKLDTKIVNRALHQLSVVSKGLANFLANNGFSVSFPGGESSANQIAQNLASAINGLAKSISTEIATSISNTTSTTIINKISLAVPKGSIVAFSGTFSGKYPIPKGSSSPDKNWALCDGTNGTPNLIDKFIRGKDATSASTVAGSDTYSGNKYFTTENHYPSGAELPLHI